MRIFNLFSWNSPAVDPLKVDNQPLDEPVEGDNSEKLHDDQVLSGPDPVEGEEPAAVVQGDEAVAENTGVSAANEDALAVENEEEAKKAPLDERTVVVLEPEKSQSDYGLTTINALLTAAKFGLKTLEFSNWAFEAASGINVIKTITELPKTKSEIETIVKVSAKYATITAQKKLGYAEKDFVDPKPVIEQKLGKIEAVYSADCKELSHWIANLAAKIALEPTNDSILKNMIASAIGKEQISDTVRVNVLSLIANGIEMGLTPPQEDEQVAENSDDSIEQEDDLKDSNIAVDQEEPAQVQDQQPPAPAGEPAAVGVIQPDEAASIVDSKPVESQQDTMTADAEKPNPFGLMIKVLADCVLAHKDDLNQVTFARQQAQLDQLALQAQIYALDCIGTQKDKQAANSAARLALKNALLHQNPDMAALELGAKRKELNLILRSKDQEVRKAFKEAAKSKLEDLQKALEEIEKERLEVFHKGVGPDVLSVFLPKEAESIYIFHPHGAVYPVQNLAWKYIKEKGPEYLTEFLPFILQVDRPALEASLEKNPYADEIKEGIDLLSDDILNLVLDKFGKPEEPANTKDKEAPAKPPGFFASVSPIPEKSKVMLHEFIKPYIEYVCLHLVQTLEQLDQDTFEKLLQVVAEVRSQLSKHSLASDEAMDIIVNGIIKAHNLLPDNVQKKLFGLPELVSVPIKKQIFIQIVIQFYTFLAPILTDLRAMKIVELPNDSIAGTALKVDDLSRSLNTIINFHVDKQLKNPKLIKVIDDKVGDLLIKKQKEIRVVGFIGHLLKAQTFDPILEGAFGLMRSDTAKILKMQLIQFLKPLIVNMGVKGLSAILEKEKNGGKAFDEELVLAVVPFVTEFLRNLNNPSTNIFKQGLQASKVKIKAFSAVQYNLILSFFLPKGEASLKELFPSLPDDHIKIIWDIVRDLKSAVEAAVGAIDADLIRDIIISIFESGIKTFTEIPKASTNNPTAIPTDVPDELTPEDLARQSRMEGELEDLIYEVARYVDLPVDRISGIAKAIPGNQAIKKKIMQAVRAGIQKQFNGHFIEKTVKSALKSQEIKIPEAPKPPNYIDQVEREFVEKGISFGLRTAGESVVNSLKRLDYPILKQIKDITVALCKFIIVRVIGGILRYFKLDERLINSLHNFLHKNRVKMQTELEQLVQKHTVVFDVVGSVENVIEKPWPKLD